MKKEIIYKDIYANGKFACVSTQLQIRGGNLVGLDTSQIRYKIDQKSIHPNLT